MNDFSILANAYPHQEVAVELVALSLWLAQTPCGPLHHRHISPERELDTLIDCGWRRLATDVDGGHAAPAN